VIYLTIRVHAPSFEPFLNMLKGKGKILSMNINAQDVTDQYVDTKLHLENREQLRRRLLGLLRNRTGRLSDILEVERELSDVTLEIDRIKGQLRYMDHQVAFSTVSLSLVSPNFETARPGGSVLERLWEGVVDGFYGFFTALGFLFRITGYLLPIALIVWAGYRIVLVILKRRRRAGTSGG
jgi:hypothetical protein